jgi:proline dehydrogenase
MPGEALADALEAAGTLAHRGMPTTLTRLGENVETEAEADAVMDQYLRVREEVEARGLDTEISVKPTQLGLDRGAEGARRRLERLARGWEGRGPVWVDMEDSSYVDRTLEVFRAVREGGGEVGLCLQAYLRRTEEDLEALLPLRPPIRLVKGAYREPPEVAFPRKGDVDRSFVRLTERLLRARAEGRAGRAVVGTHDPRMIAAARTIARSLGLDPSAWEVAMLYGIRTADQVRLAGEACTVRVLISYGEAWFPWYMRRLAERPANVWFVARQVLG